MHGIVFIIFLHHNLTGLQGTEQIAVTQPFTPMKLAQRHPLYLK